MLDALSADGNDTNRPCPPTRKRENESPLRNSQSEAARSSSPLSIVKLIMKPIISCCVAVALATAAVADSASAADPVVVDLTTSAGVIRLELDAEKAPKTVANFIAYVNSGHYAGTVFHRVIRDFMIQGGGLTADLKEKRTEPPIVNEAGNGLLNRKYTIAMARTSDPNSATSQFFINTADNTSLDRAAAADGVGYAVFGKVIAGQDVVNKIAATQTTSGADPITAQPLQNVPVQPILITGAKVVSGP